jgi:hypothetical protein
MMRHGTAMLAAAALLAACTSSGDSDTKKVPEPEHPVLAYALQSNEGGNDTSLVFSGGHQREARGLVNRFLPNGSVLVDRFPADGGKGGYSVVLDPETGHEVSSRDVFDPGEGVIGFGRRTLLAVDRTSGHWTFRELRTDFTKTREVSLPGNPDITGGKHRATLYGDLVGGDGVVFVGRSDWRGVDSVHDAVIRIGPGETTTTILKDKHVTDLTLASDGRSVLAALAEAGPYYEGSPPITEIVELDPRNGTVARSLGMPPPCRHFEPVFDSASCIVRLDKVGGVVAASVYESKPPADSEIDAYSTWRHGNGGWTEVKAQRGKMVYWQSATRRLEQTMRLDSREEKSSNPIVWVKGEQHEELPDTSEFYAFDWVAPGSLIHP